MSHMNEVGFSHKDFKHFPNRYISSVQYDAQGYVGCC